MMSTDGDKQKPGSGDDQEDATNRGVSSEEPAEGTDRKPPERPGSPKG
jgi:hypothetical protein